MRIAVIGAGNVGFSLAVLLAQRHELVVVDRDAERVRLIGSGQSPIPDPEVRSYFGPSGQGNHYPRRLTATLTLADALAEGGGFDCILIAVPTDYDQSLGRFNTSGVEEQIRVARELNPDGLIVIKSTVPVGFTGAMRAQFKTDNIIFCPEFLREGKALHDNLYPSRIVVGDKGEAGQLVASLFNEVALEKEVPNLLMDSAEAEAIKLFANTYLAMRVAYFNELDSYAMNLGLNSRQIIDGVCTDPRIGNYYNNPGFGYGGYCLPKDTKQLLSGFSDVPQNLIKAIVESNLTRISWVADDILQRIHGLTGLERPVTVGLYRLVTKPGTHNYEHSPMLSLARQLLANKLNLIAYEPLLNEARVAESVQGLKLVTDLDEFKASSDLIIANRNSGVLQSVQTKVYTRDLFGEN